jgi:hypothetical protein
MAEGQNSSFRVRLPPHKMGRPEFGAWHLPIFRSPANLRRPPRKFNLFKMSVGALGAHLPILNSKEVIPMLHITYSDTSNGQHWNLYGLIGRWIDQLRCFWRQAREHVPRTHALVDLKDLDEAGKDLLKDMYGAGAEFVVAEVKNADSWAEGLRPMFSGQPCHHRAE